VQASRSLPDSAFSTLAGVRLRVLLLVAALACLLAVPAAQAKSTTVRKSQGTITTTRLADGVRHLKFRWGPIKITPGQNTISLADDKLLPPGPGWITSFKPDLTYVDGKVPRVDIIHLHHAVWVVTGPANGLRPTWAAGEEKTIFGTPKGFGWRYRTSDHWLLNHMIHNLTPAPTKVFITWEMDFIPLGARAARGMQEVKTQWLDVEGLKAYPVFDALQGTGVNGQFTYPDDKPDAYAGIAPRNQWVVDHDATLVGTAGHLHPGGLWTDLKLTRDGRTVEVFRSRAKYFEPAGAVSWDVAMTATPRTWKVAVKKGDVLSVSGTYDTRTTSWYEVMAIMPVAITNVPAGGVDPFLVNTAVPGVLTHGHLPENDHHGGAPGRDLSDARRLPDGPRTPTVDISQFIYRQGDLTGAGAAGRPPVVSVGQPLTFVNDDASRNIFHTITACRAPCTATTGIAFPLANGPVTFDSGELGYGPVGFTAASNRKQWQTPTDLGAGTYTYFCRIHPFMRGAFRVKG
jgi:plastocyanin